ncbi:DUF459 domain-containing protein [bacterium]|nr:DUF459 domain-containing protein [bacterium]
MTSSKRTTEGRRLRPAAHALLTVLVALVMATFLNSDTLLKTAERQPLGSRTRAIAVGVMEPIVSISDTFRLDRPRAMLDSLLGKGDDSAAVAVTTTTTSTTIAPDPGVTTTSSTTTTTFAARPVYTADEPLKLWIIGDSFIEHSGPSLQADIAETGAVETEIDFRFISGLIRPDVFDWPAHVTARLPVVQADVVVAQYGGNDGQETYVDNVLVAPSDEAWQALYKERVLEVMDIVLASGVEEMYWLGLPIMRDEAFSANVRIMNAIYAEAASERDLVTFIDVYDFFADDDGEFSTLLENSSGDLVAMRTPDGAHYTWDGAYKLTDMVAQVIIDDLGLPPRS